MTNDKLIYDKNKVRCDVMEKFNSNSHIHNVIDATMEAMEVEIKAKQSANAITSMQTEQTIAHIFYNHDNKDRCLMFANDPDAISLLKRDDLPQIKSEPLYTHPAPVTSMQTEQPVTGDSTPDHLPDWSNAKELSESSALEALLLLKRYKDAKGKDAWYSRQQPLVWALAAKARGKSAPVTSMQGGSAPDGYLAEYKNGNVRIVFEEDYLDPDDIEKWGRYKLTPLVRYNRVKCVSEPTDAQLTTAAYQARIIDANHDWMPKLEVDTLIHIRHFYDMVKRQLHVVDDRVKGVSDSKSVIQQALDCITEEINPNNYNHDLVHQFVNEYDQMVGILQSTLNGQLSTNTDGWVSVDVKLPPMWNWYLVVINNSMVTMAFLDGLDGGDIYWLTHKDTERNNFEDKSQWEDVTHWQPLPSPPINAISQPKGEWCE